jgi:asparagine synthase (glutamine-hydrolysing)
MASEPLTTIGIGADDKFNTDAPFARKVSQLLGTNHHEHYFKGDEIDALPQIVYHIETPYFEPGVILTHCALEEAAKHGNVVVGGEAADQLFACSGPSAYRRYTVRKKIGPLLPVMCGLIRGFSRSSLFDGQPLAHRIEGRLIGKYDVNNWYPAYGFWNTHIKEMLKENFRFQDRFDNSHIPDSDLHLLYEFCCVRLNIEYALYGILGRYSGLSELHNAKCYSPYIDREVINFALSLDHDLRAPMVDPVGPQYVTKYLHKELAKEMFPPEIIDRPKQGGFIHNAVHFNDERFLEKLKNKISKSEIINRHFRAGAIADLFKRPKANSTRIFLLTVLDLWHHLFVSDPSERAPTYTLSEFIE